MRADRRGFLKGLGVVAAAITGAFGIGAESATASQSAPEATGPQPGDFISERTYRIERYPEIRVALGWLNEALYLVVNESDQAIEVVNEANGVNYLVLTVAPQTTVSGLCLPARWLPGTYRIRPAGEGPPRGLLAPDEDEDDEDWES